MAGVRFTELQARPMAFLDFTSLTLDEFQQLVPPFEAAFQARMATWRMDGKPRTARRFSVYKNCPLPTPEDRLLFILVYLKTYALQVVQGRLFGMVQSKANQWIHVLLPALLAALRALGDAPARSLTALAQRLGVVEADVAPWVAPLAEEPAPVATVPAATPTSPLFAHDGTERRIVRPQDAAEQTECYSGKKKDHTVKNVLLVNALLTILFLSDTYGGRVHDLRIAEATPYPLPAGSGLLQDLGFLAFTLPAVEILMPTKKPRGQELTREQQCANQALNQRRLRIEHVNSSVKRCRIVKDRIRLWKEGVRDLVMELCCALHNFRVRLKPWLPMI
jgi:DDE superfamily endonuclease/Helix-turn-helix of DDE superfamily endonuclease